MLATGEKDLNSEQGAGLETLGDAFDGDHLIALEAEPLPAQVADELQRQHAHADEVRTMDALEALRDHRAYAQKLCAFGRPVARRAGAIFLSGEDHERHPFPGISHRRIIDRQAIARWMVGGDTAFDAQDHLVLDPDVGESAAHHDFVIAAP